MLVGPLMLLVACASTSNDHVVKGGPLQPADHSRTTWFHESQVGQTFSDGFTVLVLSGSAPATIESVTSLGGGDAWDFLGARVGLPGRPDDFNQNMRGFPPKAVPAKFQVDAAGTVLEPGKLYMLIMGYRVAADTLDWRDRIDIVYTVAGKRYRASLDRRVVSCPPPLTESECADLPEFKS